MSAAAETSNSLGSVNTSSFDGGNVPDIGQGVDVAVIDGGAGELSLLHLFLQADIIVKVVMLMLVFASIWCWGIIFSKISQFKAVRRRSKKFEKAFWSASSLEELYEQLKDQRKDPMAAVFTAAMAEWQHSNENKPKDAKPSATSHLGLEGRIDRVMRLTIRRESEKLEHAIPFLASVGSTAPFVGLFGTVWGIMNSFTAIANEQNSSLAVVAPGIAEALFATALGLVAAIPAVLAYNRLISDLDRYVSQLEAFSDQMAAVVSRQAAA